MYTNLSYCDFKFIGIKRGIRNLRRKKLKKKRHRNYVRHCLNISVSCKRTGLQFEFPPKPLEIRKIIKQHTRPEFSDTIKYLASKQKAFVKESVQIPEDGIFEVPQIFSLTENDTESFLFLKRLFYTLHQDKLETIILDYKNCERIDLDASICMDILLQEFILHIRKCRQKRYPLVTQQIIPKNYNKNINVLKTLFSIGAYSTLRGIRIPFTDIIPYPLCTGYKRRKNAGAQREIDITRLMEYVLLCLKRSNKELTAEAEDNLYKVIGEILINAEEHSDMDRRYSIGFFQHNGDNNDNEHEGVFNLVIFNFGQTIYEKFKDINCPNQTVVKQMQALSETYTKKNFFLKSEFEEETLWTLYALQEGVTSHKDWKRGNGSIRFIDSFFKLKGNLQHDNFSKMAIMSGNARILFDGSYGIIEKHKEGQRKPSKLMTFNTSGGFDDKPDKKFVSFADNYFPGTMIVAKIGIKFNILTDKEQ